MLVEAINITIPDFNERKIAEYRLIYKEIVLINSLANYMASANEIERAIEILERLRRGMNRSYVDDYEKVRMYLTVLYNYSKYLGMKGRYIEALAIVDEGEKLCRAHKRAKLLYGFAINRACCLFEVGKEKESVPYFAMAYHGAALVNESFSQKPIRKYVEERSILDLDS